MQSESRLQRRTLGTPRDTYQDDMMAEKEDSPIDNLITVAAAGAGLYGIYRKGLLKPIVKSFVEVAEKVASSSSDKAYTSLDTIKSWSSLNNLSKQTLKEMDLALPKNSMFRSNTRKKMLDVAKDLKDGLVSGNANANLIKSIVNDTANDIRLLTTMMEDNSNKLTRMRESYYNTDLMGGFRELEKFSREVMANSPDVQLVARSKATKIFVDKNLLSREKELEHLKRKGFRPVVLEDIIKKPIVNADGKLVLETKPGAVINLYDNKPGQSGSSMGYLNTIMDNPYYRYVRDGKTTNMIGDWENVGRMVVDKNLFVDENGKLIDTRMTGKMFTDFKKSLATDFKIPGLNFNPLNTLFPSWGRGDIRPATFGILSKNDAQPFITKMAGKTKLGDVIGSDVLVFNGEGYKVAGNQLEKIGDNFILHDISRAKQFGFSKKMESLRKIMGVEYNSYSLKKDTKFHRAVANASKWLDAAQPDVNFKKTHSALADDIGGRTIQDAREMDEVFNIDNIISEKIMDTGHKFNVFDTANPTIENTSETIFGSGPSKIAINEFDEEEPRRFIATVKGMNFSDIKDQDGIAGKTDYLKHYMKQFFVGRNKDGSIHEEFTDKSLEAFGLFDNVFERFSGIAPQLGFSTKSKANTWEYIKNVALKRVLPIYALTQAPQLLNAMSEPIFQLLGMNDNEDGTDNRMNIEKFMASGVVKPLDVGMHKVKDTLGLTKLFKFVEEFTPGFDQINELPGVYHLGLTQTTEERQEYIEKGMDPVRKGRYWSMGNTPLTGGKIMYWRPNMYRRIAADVDFSDSKWGSRQEYYNNTWYPNPINPLAPLNHFLFDKHHYDEKHYYDRPYLISSSAGGNIPILGPLYQATIGEVISPKKRMHEEYWQDGRPVENDDEQVALIQSLNDNAAYQRQDAINTAFINNTTITGIVANAKASQESDAIARTETIQRAKQLTQETAYLPGFQNVAMDSSSSSSGLSNLEVYTTPSGSSQLVDIPSTMTTWDANQRVHQYSVKKIAEADVRVTTQDNRYNPQLVDYSNEKINNHFAYGVGEQYNFLANLFGMKGFEMQTFVTGRANERSMQIEDSGYAYSFNKTFWDENLGGLGGDASEIFRRFVQRRNTGTEYINPIRNTMPSWMPGRNYFTDFKHGDPYSKVENGEERLPGEGYERLYGINSRKLFELGIGSSFIGRTKEEIIKHFLHQDNLTPFGVDVTEKGTKMHEEIEKSWLDAGLAIDTEQKIEDKDNHILGFYDAKVRDLNSETGVAIVDIKTVGDKKFNKVKKEGKPLYEHQSQVNYYLWATNNTRSNGYIYYVNRDKPEETLTMGFQFDKDLLEENLKTLQSARDEINTNLENGQLGRGELYDDLDRLRVLADVAPYSDEFTQTKAKLSADKQLSIEEQEEISQIGDRVKKQKEPLRVYPYKFKTANLQSEDVTVKKIIDNNTLLVDRYGTEHAIKFAGIHVSESNTDKYNEDLTMNEAAGNEIRKHLKTGDRITINYDMDDANKFRKDSTESVRAVINARGKNLNRVLLNRGLAKEKDTDDTPAAIHARYSKNEIAFGSAMESMTHWIGQIPFIGNKLLQVKSPYEQYRDREVYGKDFQSWNHPIKDFLIPEINKISTTHGVGSVFVGAFIGSLFGKSKYGKLIGGSIGAGVAIIGKANAAYNRTDDRDWIPKNRKDQHELNEYFDMLKYVKNMKLYETYKQKALKENRIDVDEYENDKEKGGIYNKQRSNELKDFKKVVKLDFKHRKSFNFKYGSPKYVDMGTDKKEIISAINKELAEIQSDRKIERLPENVIKAIAYKQQAEQTMYGYDAGDPLSNLMTALPKKERQYFKYFMKAPEEEKGKILRIAPDFLRRGLQQAWGMNVDEKPSLQEYFQTHGLPDASWVGWDEDSNMEDVKVKLVHNNKLDMGEFDLWDDQITAANEAEIPIPKMHSQNSNSVIQLRLKNILGKMGYEDAVVSRYHSSHGNKNTLNIYQDSRDDVSVQIESMSI